MNTFLGRCPICTEALTRDTRFLVCPSGDYMALEKTFSDRWEKFNKEKGPDRDPDYSGGVEAEKLLRDLQEMNLKGA